MSDVFISYARSSEEQARLVEHALRGQGYRVWRDDELPAHRSYSEVIEERLKEASAVVVLWSSEAAASQWVRAEADYARTAGTLAQARLDNSQPPIPFNQIQFADLNGWKGDTQAPGWAKLAASVAALAGPSDASCQHPSVEREGVSICVLPFQNMSGEAEQEYFSDGISEDITTDLSKVSALAVTARNTAFQFKGQSVDVGGVARKLGVTHVLEGSVRKAGNRVRITAQLIDGVSGDHVWAERFDRDLTDIFAIQDEISSSIVDALKLKLLPKEKKAIEDRGTSNVDAYNVYLMARQHWISGVYGDYRRDGTIVRLCQQAVSIDPNYARAWALMALAQAELRFWHGQDVDALEAAERALSLDPEIPEAHCVKARYLEGDGKPDEANKELELALKLAPDSWEVHREIARLRFRNEGAAESIPFFEKATALMSGDFHSPGMLVTCYRATGDTELLKRAATLCVERAEAAIASDPTNTGAFAKGSHALAALGQHERAKEWIVRASLLDPESATVPYNLACTLLCQLKDEEAALDMMEQSFARTSATMFKHSLVDPDLDSLRDHPRYKAMEKSAMERLGLPSAPTS